MARRHVIGHGGVPVIAAGAQMRGDPLAFEKDLGLSPMNGDKPTLMSKGPGRIERAIVAILAAAPDSAFTVDELCLGVYGPGLSADSYRALILARMYRPQLQHRVAAIRAGKAIAGRGGNVAWLHSGGRGGALVFYTADNVMSYGMARLKGWRTSQTEDQLRGRLTGDHARHIQPGGAWWLNVQLFIAKRHGDADRAAEIQRAIDRQTAAFATSFRALSDC
jgi:hypothetical protein